MSTKEKLLEAIMLVQDTAITQQTLQDSSCTVPSKHELDGIGIVHYVSSERDQKEEYIAAQNDDDLDKAIKSEQENYITVHTDLSDLITPHQRVDFSEGDGAIIFEGYERFFFGGGFQNGLNLNYLH